jgi:hypothetical protein
VPALTYSFDPNGSSSTAQQWFVGNSVTGSATLKLDQTGCVNSNLNGLDFTATTTLNVLEIDSAGTLTFMAGTVAFTAPGVDARGGSSNAFLENKGLINNDSGTSGAYYTSELPIKNDGGTVTVNARNVLAVFNSSSQSYSNASFYNTGSTATLNLSGDGELLMPTGNADRVQGGFEQDGGLTKITGTGAISVALTDNLPRTFAGGTITTDQGANAGYGTLTLFGGNTIIGWTITGTTINMRILGSGTTSDDYRSACHRCTGSSWRMWNRSRSCFERWLLGRLWMMFHRSGELCRHRV